MFQIALADQNLFFFVRGFHDDPSKRIAKKRSAPEFQALALSAIAANVAMLMPHTIDHSHKDSVGDGMCALDGAPRVMLYRAELSFLVRMPADGGGIKKNISALQSCETRTFWIPLVPANESSHASMLGVKGLKAEIARSEVKLLIVKRIIRDMHLAIKAFGAAIGVEDDRRVVVQAARAPLKNGNHH